jgi:predicted alpha/beta hydrolase
MKPINLLTDEPASFPVIDGVRAEASPRVLFLPAMGVPASYYEPFLARLRLATGANVDCLDFPGQAGHPMRARRGDDYGYREIVEDLIPSAAASQAARAPAAPVVIVGHSLGGQLGLLALATLAPQVRALVLVASGTAHWRAWPISRRPRAALLVHAIAAASGLLPWYPGQRLGFGGDQSRRFMRDWSFNARHGRYRLEGSARTTQDIEAQLEAVRVRVHLLSIEGDPVAPPGASDELLRLLPNAAVTRHTVSAVSADPPWRRHFSWARQPSDVDSTLARCLTATATTRWFEANTHAGVNAFEEAVDMFGLAPWPGGVSRDG